jgi:hypothetical protein
MHNKILSKTLLFLLRLTNKHRNMVARTKSNDDGGCGVVVENQNGRGLTKRPRPFGIPYVYHSSPCLQIEYFLGV